MCVVILVWNIERQHVVFSRAVDPLSSPPKLAPGGIVESNWSTKELIFSYLISD